MFSIILSYYNKLRKNVFEQREALKQIKNNQKINISQTAKIDLQNIILKNNNCLYVREGSIIEARIVFECDGAQIKIGSNTFIGNSNLISANLITIGNDVLITWGCYIVDHNSHSLKFEERSKDVKNWYKGEKDWSTVLKRPVFIKDKAWIGFNSIILKGVTVGEGSVIGAGSVVTKDIPDWSIAAGNPAIILKSIPEDERT